MSQKRLIVLAQHDKEKLGITKFLLETHGYAVMGSTNPQLVLDFIEQDQRKVRLLMADLLLDSMDGNELVRRARTLNPHLSTLIYSDAISDYARAVCADRFLPKGHTMAEMLRVVSLLTKLRMPSVVAA